jgi:hypothetical protein
LERRERVAAVFIFVGDVRVDELEALVERRAVERRRGRYVRAMPPARLDA